MLHAQTSNTGKRLEVPAGYREFHLGLVAWSPEPHLSLRVLIEHGHALELLHLAVQRAQRHAGAQPPEGFEGELHLLAGREEHEHLRLQRAQHMSVGTSAVCTGA